MGILESINLDDLELIFFLVLFLPSLGHPTLFPVLLWSKYIYLLSILLILIILEFYSICYGLIVILLLVTNLIFIGSFRGLNLYEYSSNKDYHIFEGKSCVA